ncbi:hypothetical protein VOLCADRAFT_48095, partial [Volvox carteri f. nagariensis]
VGFLWGSTNPFVKRGSDIVQKKLCTTPNASLISKLGTWVLTPSFVVPHGLNQSGSGLFIYLLGSSDISVLVPAANACSLVFNALADLALGESFRLVPLALGTSLVAIGVLIC